MQFRIWQRQKNIIFERVANECRQRALSHTLFVQTWPLPTLTKLYLITQKRKRSATHMNDLQSYVHCAHVPTFSQCLCFLFCCMLATVCGSRPMCPRLWCSWGTLRMLCLLVWLEYLLLKRLSVLVSLRFQMRQQLQHPQHAPSRTRCAGATFAVTVTAAVDSFIAVFY